VLHIELEHRHGDVGPAVGGLDKVQLQTLHAAGPLERLVQRLGDKVTPLGVTVAAGALQLGKKVPSEGDGQVAGLVIIQRAQHDLH